MIDVDDGKELEGTFMTLKDKNRSQMTNEHGSYKFTNLCPECYQLIIQHVGCRDSVITIDLKKDTKLIIKLPHSAVELNQIDVMDKQPDMIKTQTVNELQDKDLDGPRGQLLGESLKLISGVTTLNTGSTISKPMTHGMFASERYVKQHVELEAGAKYHQKHLQSFYYIGNDLVAPGLNIRNVSWNIGAVIKDEPFMIVMCLTLR